MRGATHAFHGKGAVAHLKKLMPLRGLSRVNVLQPLAAEPILHGRQLCKMYSVFGRAIGTRRRRGPCWNHIVVAEFMITSKSVSRAAKFWLWCLHDAR